MAVMASPFVVIFLSQFLHIWAFVHIQLPPISTVEVTNGSNMTILHGTWFNNSEDTLQLYAGFNTVIHQTSGAYINGNFLVEYSGNCQELRCEKRDHGVLQWNVAGGEGTRCQTVRVTVIGHEDVSGGMIHFHRVNINNFNIQVVGTVQVVVLPAQVDVVTTDSTMLTNPPTSSSVETTTDETVSDCQQQGESVANMGSADAVVYSLAVIFLTMSTFNLATVGFLVFWTMKHGNSKNAFSTMDSDECCQLPMDRTKKDGDNISMDL